MLDWSLTEFLPGPLAERTVVSSARKVNEFEVKDVKPKL